MAGLGDNAAARFLKRPLRSRRVRPSEVDPGLERLRSDSSLSVDALEILDRTDSRIHPDDEMYLGDPEHYFSVGLSGLQCIEAARAQPDSAPATPEPAQILDFACGYGRVQRFLRARFPLADITAAEINPAALTFCAERYGAGTIEVPADPLDLGLSGAFDLIWCGSLVTHLDGERIRALLNQFSSSLAPGGVAVVSSHGAHAASHEWTLAPAEPADRAKLVSEFEETGAGYAPYEGTPNYGVSLTSLGWLRKTASDFGLEPGWSAEQAWAEHQDVTALWKPAQTASVRSAS